MTHAARLGTRDARSAWGPTARSRPGANVNLLTDAVTIDPLSGTAVLSGIPVDVAPA